MLLAFDTSTQVAGVALYDQGGLIAESAWVAGRDHAAQLLPQADTLLRFSRRERGELRAVAVALGPGSWSGLRVGLSTAKGLALALAIPIIGVATLDALASQHRRGPQPIYPLIRLGRERFGTATYQARPELQRLTPYRNVTLADLCVEARDGAMFCGEVTSEVREVLLRDLGERARFPEADETLRRPGFLAALAWQRLLRGEHDDLSALEPIYLGEPVKPTRA